MVSAGGTLGRPRATVRTFFESRWRIVCCSVQVRGPISEGARGRSRPGCHCAKWLLTGQPRRQWAQTSSAAFGEFVQVWRQGVSFHQLGDAIAKGWVTSGTARSGPGGDEMGTDWTNVKAAVCQPLFGDLALQKPGGVHLDVVL